VAGSTSQVNPEFERILTEFDQGDMVPATADICPPKVQQGR
jgi:hypothetical protein